MYRFFLAIIFIFSSFQAYSQEDQPKFSERVFFGGNFSASFANGVFVEVSPIVGYRLTDRLSVGTGITYQYLKVNNRDVDFSTSVYGGRLFTRYTVVRNIFLHGEYERLNLDVLSLDSDDEFILRREWIPGAFAGGGFIQPVGGRASFSAYVLYNFLHEEGRSPYNSPVVVRVGINL